MRFGVLALLFILLFSGCSFWSKSSKPTPKSDASAEVLLKQSTDYLNAKIGTFKILDNNFKGANLSEGVYPSGQNN